MCLLSKTFKAKELFPLTIEHFKTWLLHEITAYLPSYIHKWIYYITTFYSLTHKSFHLIPQVTLMIISSFS